jgi:hypothetical protein
MFRSPKFSPRAVIALALVAALSLAGGALAADTPLKATMNGKSEVPKGDPDGTGTATLTPNSTKGQVCYTIKLTKVGTVTQGHIHKGPPGKAGPIVVPLFAKAATQPKGCANGVKKALITAIEKNPAAYYVNVHNKKYPGGAVRGQLHK